MPFMLKILLSLLFVFALNACGGPSRDGMTPFPNMDDPKDSVLFEAVAKYVAKQNAPPNSVYDHVRIDLNGDRRREGIVLFKLPHTHWCGWDGCGMVIFKAGKKSFTPMTALNSIRGPIYVNGTGNEGWRDIIIRTSGTKMRDKNIVLKYDGTGYPSSLLLAPTLRLPISKMTVETYFR